MQATDRTFREIINNNIEFIVPVFQRDYKWGPKEWQRLWGDVNRAGSGNPHTGHFLGSLVQIDTGKTTPSLGSWLVIDGQQRLATLTLLVAALRDHIDAASWKREETDLTVELLDDLFLKNRHARGDARYKLSLRRTDNATIHVIVDGNDLDNVDGSLSRQVADGYRFFKEKLMECDPEAVYHSIASLRIVEVTLDRQFDDPQFVFESLNDTGVDLSPGDMVRNYLLMRLEEQEQTRLYTEYWSKIEGCFRTADGQLNDDEFNSFLQNYLALKRGERRRPIPENRLYEEFKKYKEGIQWESTLEQLLADVRRFAGYYAAFRGRQPIPSQKLSDAMLYVRRRGTTPTTLVMKLWDCYDRQHTLAEEDFIEALALIESYLFRRAVIGFQTRWSSYWSLFADLARNIDQSPLETVKWFLQCQAEWYWPWRFPGDTEFDKALQERDIYALGIICKRILERLEESFEGKHSIFTNKLEIEHIMPQSIESSNEPHRTYGKKWQKMLGSDWQQVHSDWLHRLGNLTLAGDNPEMSNKPFDEKKAFYAENPLRLTQFVRKQPVWTAVEMEKRGRELADRALRIWPSPSGE